MTARCKGCGQDYRLEVGRTLGLADKSLHSKALRYAREEEIDLPGAFSVLMGILTPEDVRAVGQSPTADGGTLAPAKGVAKGRKAFDPAFGPAVEAGTLSARQATERGSRAAFVSRLVQRHRLSDALAESVADNRTSLLMALRRREATKTITARVQTDSHRSRTAVLAVVLVGLVFAVAVWKAASSEAGTDLAAEQGKDEHALPSSMEFQVDAQGRILQIIGPDPESVLQAYCNSGSPRGRWEALDLASAEPPSTRTRLGILRDTLERDAVRTIAIRQDLKSLRWVAGDGISRLVDSPAPQGIRRLALVELSRRSDEQR